ncbi:MAG: acetyl-CoA decarbonylase/synthase complex subunit gamma [Anaerolineales bacterium]|nr:acetyl-CoA decarbonylase/synthase complex subunit gamma [Anaerolineales bacterium]
MALTGLQIYKLLPKTNCKDCGYPTCLAFAMKLAAQQAELKDCPHVSEEAQQQLESASAPPIRLVEVGVGEHAVQVGNETVLFRHEKTFYHKPGLFIRINDDLPLGEIQALVSTIDTFEVDYVGISLVIDGFAVACTSGSTETYCAAVEAVCTASQKAVILLASDPETARAGAAVCQERKALLGSANPDNWEEMVEIANEFQNPLIVRAGSLAELADLTGKIQEKGIENLVLDPQLDGYLDSLQQLTALRRLALKSNFRPLGFPVLTCPGSSTDPTLLATEHIAKYAGFIVLDTFDPATAYALLVLRENIYTDPQKPIQVTPGLYEINNPDGTAPLLVTTNFSITYFSVANEIESSGIPCWLLVTDSEGMSVLTAWAAGKFDAERIAKDAKSFSAAGKVLHHKIIIPGHVAVISGDLEEELPDWQIMVGPREAVDISSYLKNVWTA